MYTYDRYGSAEISAVFGRQNVAGSGVDGVLEELQRCFVSLCEYRFLV